MSYNLLTDKAQVREAMAYIASQTAHDDPRKWAALDLETVGLTPFAHGTYVRLAQFANDEVGFVIDFGQGENNFFNEVAHLLQEGNFIVYNIGFERRWMYGAGTDCGLHDLALLRKAIQGGGKQRLVEIAREDINEDMDKEFQQSNWDAPQLTQQQYDYAYKDADITWRLWNYWLDRSDKGRWNAFKMFNDMSPAVIEMELSGLLLDRARHAELTQSWVEARTSVSHTLREITGNQIENLSSAQQWSKYLVKVLPASLRKSWAMTGKTGNLSMAKEHVEACAVVAPKDSMLAQLMYALLDYKSLDKYISTYGQSLIEAAEKHPDCRVRGRFNTAFAITGRFTGSTPNMQQLPRDAELLGEVQTVRNSFIAPQGYKLISLDYSGIELRVAGLLSGDKQLTDDAVYGDIHSEMASLMEGRQIDKTDSKDKMLRGRAKGASFLLLYGGGATTLSVALKSNLSDGKRFIKLWESKYPNAFALRHKTMSEVLANQSYLRCHDGGTIFMGHKVSIPTCANYPVQRTALSVMARALAIFKTRLDEERMAGRLSSAHLLATIHDQIIAEADDNDSQGVYDLMEQAMLDGYEMVFPNSNLDNLVEGGIGQSWGEV